MAFKGAGLDRLLVMGDLQEAYGADIGVVRRSAWLLIDQAMIDRFADATMDHQYIHVDPRSAALSPFEGTIAHGFLTLSLLVHLTQSVNPAEGAPSATIVNYGFDRVRFTQPVPSGSRIRAVSKLVSIEEKRPGQIQMTHDIAVEQEGRDQPALIATWITVRLA